MDDRTIDSIFAGSLKCLPAVSSKIVRIFTSSTFTDTTMERNTLMAQCYPKLKDYCREKHGLEFQVVDMRWGVRDEATDDHMTTELCMREIENCQRLSMGPNFVVFLGQKYGYRPIPTYILSSELQLLRDELAACGTDVTLLDMWYRKDANAVPAISVLQPISSILVNFNNKRIPKLQQHDQAVWWDTLGKMQKLLRKSAHSLYSSGKLDKDSMHNYFMSVTEREVINGVLNVKNTKNHCLAYLRYINNINLQNIKKASLYIDILNRSVDSEAVKLLADLRDTRVPNRIETTNIQKYHIDWIGREGLDTETHGEYLQHFITHFYRNIIKLVDRAMRKEDSSAQGQIVTEILQHLHVCNNSVKVFYGREENLVKIEEYMLGDNDKPLVLYGEGGCGKTSLLAKCVELSANKWFANARPVCVIRFLGTTPDSSALAPALLSICQQISYNYMLPLEDIPTELVPLQALLKHLLTLASPNQPLLLFLDSVDQLKGAQDAANKVSWLPLALPKLCKIIVSCAAEENNQEVSKDYHLLSRMIDNRDNFIEVTALGEELAINVMKMWMKTNGRDLTNYQWRLVCNTIEHCSLPILVKLVFAEVSRWRSYTKPQDTKLANTVTDSIMMLFERIEKQHGRLLVFHALAYITASKSGLSESELEDLISLDDKVLDDVYQYHLPPVRRIPPLLWTRIRNDLPNYLTEREADGVSVCNWYHRQENFKIYAVADYLLGCALNYNGQFRETAKEMYFKNQNMAHYFHSMIADYFLGIWGGGTPKPFKYTEIQRHRFNLTDRDGAADRKVPVMPLVFYSKEGKISRYNLRKFGEMPYHLVRSRRFQDLYEHVLFNYEWLHAKLSSCPLQAVLADYEDACNNLEILYQRELILVADALRLGGAILGIYPDMLAPQLIGRLLPEMGPNKNVHMLLKQCDALGPKHCSLLPIYHCLHTPGGPLKYSLEGHQFAVFGFCLTSDFRYIVSISNRFLTWDLSTSDLARDVNPALEGLMQELCLSPDNRYAAAFTNNNQTVLLNTLTSEYVIIENPLPEEEPLQGIFVLNSKLFIHGLKFWCIFNMKGQLIETLSSNESEWKLLQMDYLNEEEYLYIFWTGNFEVPEMMIKSFWNSSVIEPLCFHSAIVLMKNKKSLYCCYEKNNYKIAKFTIDFDSCIWTKEYELPSPNYKNEEEEEILQLKIDYGRGGTGLGELNLAVLATTYNGFVIWDLGVEDLDHGLVNGPPEQPPLVLPLPHSIHNISTRKLESNSIMISVNRDLAVAGVRKNLYVWNLENCQLVKILDAHFGRIISLQPLIIGNWNYVITSSIDRSVKVWNINNIFEQVHVIDRHELQIDAISLSQLSDIAVTVTRGCVGVWDIRLGKLVSKLADSPLGAIVTHALITPDAKYIISAESGNILIWNRTTEQVISKDEQPGIRQLTWLDNGTRLLAISLISVDSFQPKALIVVRNIPGGKKEFSVTYPVKASIVGGSAFNPGIINCDGSCIAVLANEKGSKDCINVYSSRNGQLISKIIIKTSKEILSLVAMPNKATHIGYITQDKATLLDLKSKKTIRTIPKWGGICTKDGKHGLFAPSRGGLELIELKRGSSVRTFIPKVAEGVFSVLCMFNSTDQYVLYYHSGKKTLRLFRTMDGVMVANFRVQTELSAVASTADGLTLVLGTADGCVSALSIVDSLYPESAKRLENLPSRDPEWKKKQGKIKANARFKAAVNIAKLSAQFSNNPNEIKNEEMIYEK